jgi:hypothetical protein
MLFSGCDILDRWPSDQQSFAEPVPMVEGHCVIRFTSLSKNVKSPSNYGCKLGSCCCAANSTNGVDGVWDCCWKGVVVGSPVGIVALQLELERDSSGPGATDAETEMVDAFAA